MSLPNPGMSFTPFDPLPASDLNDIVENIEALAAGTGLNDDSVTAPKIVGLDKSNLTTDSNPYKFSAGKTGNQAIPGGVATKVGFNTERFDTNNNYDAVTTFRYTAPVAGFYFVNGIAQTLLGTTVTDINLQLFKNGTLFRKGGNLKNGVYAQPQVVGFFQLAASDYLEIFFINVAGGDTIEGAVTSSSFEAFLICRT